MKRAWKRALAQAIAVRLLARLLTGRLADWARAMAAEIEAIADEREALRYALGCLHAAIGMALRAGLQGGWARLRQRSPRALGLAGACGATLLGCTFMLLAGAPRAYVPMQLASLLLALASYALLPSAAWRDRLRRGGLPGAWVLAMGLALLATALFGNAFEGLRRWVQIGPLTLQPSLLFMPCLLLVFARSRGVLAELGLGLAALALALQADRALSATLAAGLGLLALRRPSWRMSGQLLLALACLAAGWVRPGGAAGAAFVDDVPQAAFALHPALGLLLGLGLLLPVLPALLGRGRPGEGEALQLFGVVWATLGLAALLGQASTPLLGFGGSAVLAYFLSLALLPGDAATKALARA